MPHLQRIGQSNVASASIEAPDYQETATFNSHSARAGPEAYGRHGTRSLKATRVIGSLDHAILPMQPVSLSSYNVTPLSQPSVSCRFSAS